MISLLLAATFQYTFQTAPVNYDVKLDFDGYLPIFGGMESTVTAKIGMVVLGGQPTGNELKVSSDLTSLDLRMDGEKLPFTIENVKQFFPKTTVNVTSLGRVIKNDAPDIDLPVRLPGLDVKRFPESTYLPVEFPESGFELGKSFSYKKNFGDSPVNYEVTPKSIEGTKLTLSVKMSQEFDSFEDEAKNMTKKKEDAFYEVSTKVDGTGTITFDTAKGQLEKSEYIALSTSVSKEIKSEKKEDRKLKTTVTVTRK